MSLLVINELKKIKENFNDTVVKYTETIGLRKKMKLVRNDYSSISRSSAAKEVWFYHKLARRRNQFTGHY